MARLVVLSNGNLLVGLDNRGLVRDVNFPFVGQENQTAGKYVHRIGVWTDNQFSWLGDPGWEIEVTYVNFSLSSHIIATHAGLKLRIEMFDAVYNERDIFIRQAAIINLDNRPRMVRLFFHQQFELYESFRRDTAYFDPNQHVLVHYKGRRVFLMNAEAEGQPFDDYSVGLFSIEGWEGTFKDAEDGLLSKNPIEHGPVDSVLGLSLMIDPGSSKKVHYWMCVSKLMSEAMQLNKYVLQKTPEYLLKSTQNYWHAWINKQPVDFKNLNHKMVSLFKKSLLVMRTHADNRGGIIASCDSDMLQHGRDNYCYVWPRDAAITALALDRAGDHGVAQRFFEFCNQVVNDEGYFMHKYRCDLALGSSWHPWVNADGPQLPIQEDETALVIYALWRHYQLTHDLEFIESVYNSLIAKATDFMVAYRDEVTGLPKPSYDLWEEKYGTSTFTASTVYGAILCAAKFANLLGKNESEVKYRTAANQIKEGILDYMYDKESGLFVKQIYKGQIDRTIDTSSVYGIFKFEVLPVDDERLTKAMSLTMHRLGLTTPVGGMARFEGDRYYRTSDDIPGNPWLITTLWMMQYYIAQAKKQEDLTYVKSMMDWVGKHATISGALPEQLDGVTGQMVSASPLIWSHAEFVNTIFDYLEKCKLK